MTVMDTDEVFYLQRDDKASMGAATGVGILASFLRYVCSIEGMS